LCKHMALNYVCGPYTCWDYEQDYIVTTRSGSNILIIKANKITISQIYSGKEFYVFQRDLLSIIRSLNTVFTAIDICHTVYDDCLLARSGPDLASTLDLLYQNKVEK
jgi:hypothetical protein